MSVWTVPVEAVRHSVGIEGARTLTALAAAYAQFQPNATAELTPNGWVATLVYSKPGFPSRVHHAHVPLVWSPAENRREGGR